MKNTTKLVALAALTAALGACTWVKLEDSGRHIRVVYDGRVGGCRALGEVSVSVKDRVGFYQRSALKVKDELETLARNEAAQMNADTISAKDEPHDGEQRFGAYQCRNRSTAESPDDARQRPAKAEGGVETYPVKD